MTSRLPKAELPAELRDTMIRQLGAVPEPVGVTYNNPKVAMSSQEFSAGVATWDAADASLKTFAHMAVTDELSAGLLERLGPAALVELTVFIGFANLASRVNTAHGITSQGYSDACEIPLAGGAGKPGAAATA